MAKAKCPEFENHERWLVSYADMLTLLFAVFVVLFALKDDGADSSQDAAGSLQESFAKPLEDVPEERRLGPTEAGFGIFDHFKGNSVMPPISKRFPGLPERAKVIKDEMARVKFLLDERLYGGQKFRDTTKPGRARIVDITQTKTGFKLQMMAKHFYDEGEIDIRKTAEKDLGVVVDILKDLGRDVTVEGHTDSLPTTGKWNNWDISGLRATHLVKYMIRKHNFPSTKLSAAGFGDSKPVAHNGTASGRALNRRVEFKIDYMSDMMIDPH